MNNPVQLKEVVSTLSIRAAENLHAILLYGSSLYSSDSIDTDLLIVLNEKGDIQNDLSLLKDIIDEFGSEMLDIQLTYRSEIKYPKLFSLDSHGSFLWESLQQAKILYGENPFLLSTINMVDKQVSLLQQVQYYLFRARQEFIGYKQPSKDNNPMFHQKKIKMIMLDILGMDGSIKNAELAEVIAIFRKKYRQIDLSLLEKLEPLEVEEGITLYEQLYSLILEQIEHNKIKDIAVAGKLKRPLRFNIDGMVVEAMLPKGKDNGQVLILMDGLPSVPDLKPELNIFADEGFTVLFPRYKGTWESSGQFLDHHPGEDIEKLISALSEGVDVRGNLLKSENVILLATSFGGSLAFLPAQMTQVKKVVLMSPVVDYQLLPSLSTLPAGIGKNFTSAYRATTKDWDRLLSGILVNPTKEIRTEDSEKYYVVGGADDETISPEMLEEFCSRYDLRLKIYDNYDHFSVSGITVHVMKDILSFVKNG